MGTGEISICPGSPAPLPVKTSSTQVVPACYPQFYSCDGPVTFHGTKERNIREAEICFHFLEAHRPSTMMKRPLKNAPYFVIAAKAGIQKLLKRLDSRLHGNDN
jgi:hypothetical protein